MINLKKQDPVADTVKEILQQEALKGNQHKIDKNKNNRIDAHDFKILRGESKPKKEEKVEEGNNPFDYKNYTSQIPKKPGETAGFDSKKVSTGTVYSRKPTEDKPAKEKPKGVKPKMEEVEQIDELKKSTVQSYINKKMDPAVTKKSKGVKQDIRSLVRAHSRMAGVKQTSEEVESVQEREMSPGETAERERIVKGMKKNLKGFKARYGDRAKSVMYATATKSAMKEETVEEAKRPESDDVPFAPPYNTSSSPVTTDKSGAKHTPVSRVKHLARMAMKKVSSDLKSKK